MHLKVGRKSVLLILVLKKNSKQKYMNIVIYCVNLFFEYVQKVKSEIKCHAEETGQNEND